MYMISERKENVFSSWLLINEINLMESNVYDLFFDMNKERIFYVLA